MAVCACFNPVSSLPGLYQWARLSILFIDSSVALCPHVIFQNSQSTVIIVHALCLNQPPSDLTMLHARVFNERLLLTSAGAEALYLTEDSAYIAPCRLCDDNDVTDDVTKPSTKAPQVHIARASRSMLILPPQNFDSAHSRSPICSSDSLMHHGGGAKMRRASTCVSVGGIVAGGGGSDELTDITGNTFRQQRQSDRQSGGIPALKPSPLLPFLMRSPRVKGALPVRFSAYSCHGAAPGPDASCDAAAAKVDGRSSTLMYSKTFGLNTMDIDGGMIAAGRRRTTPDRGTTDLDRISSSMQLIAAGRPLGQAMSELRRAAKAWKHCAPEVAGHY